MIQKLNNSCEIIHNQSINRNFRPQNYEIFLQEIKISIPLGILNLLLMKRYGAF